MNVIVSHLIKYVIEGSVRADWLPWPNILTPPTENNSSSPPNWELPSERGRGGRGRGEREEEGGGEEEREKEGKRRREKRRGGRREEEGEGKRRREEEKEEEGGGKRRREGGEMREKGMKRGEKRLPLWLTCTHTLTYLQLVYVYPSFYPITAFLVPLILLICD